MSGNIAEESDLVFEYSFTIDYGNPIRVVVDFPFKKKDEMELFNNFPRKQMHRFAEHILRTYATEKYHSLAEKDFFNPFARKISKVFRNGTSVYWTRCPRDTVLIISENE